MLIDAPPTLLNTIIHKKHLLISHFMAKSMNELAHKSPLIPLISILVPRGRAPFGQHQESRPLNPQRSNECACLSCVEMDCAISIETSSAKMAADLNFAVCVSFREDKPKTKQLRFLL